MYNTVIKLHKPPIIAAAQRLPTTGGRIKNRRTNGNEPCERSEPRNQRGERVSNQTGRSTALLLLVAAAAAEVEDQELRAEQLESIEGRGATAGFGLDKLWKDS